MRDAASACVSKVPLYQQLHLQKGNSLRQQYRKVAIWRQQVRKATFNVSCCDTLAIRRQQVVSRVDVRAVPLYVKYVSAFICEKAKFEKDIVS
jgi:hypothetical protein